MQTAKLLGLFLAALLPPFIGPMPLAAQAIAPGEQSTPEAESAQARALLGRALERMAGLSSCGFTAEVDFGASAEDGNARVFLSPMLGPPPVGKRLEGAWFHSGLVAFTLDGTDKGLLHKGLAFYRSGSAWRPRLATGPAGEPFWWVPDPARLLAELSDEQAKVTIDRNEILAQRPVRVLKLAFDGDRAADLLLSGMAPDPSKVPLPRRGTSFVTSTSFGGRSLPKDLAYTFELWVDASTGLVHRLSILGSCANTATMEIGRASCRERV